MTSSAAALSCSAKTPCPLCTQTQSPPPAETKNSPIFAYLRDAPHTDQTERDDSSEILNRLHRGSLEELLQKISLLKRKECLQIETMARVNQSRALIISLAKEPLKQSEIDSLSDAIAALRVQLNGAEKNLEDLQNNLEKAEEIYSKASTELYHLNQQKQNYPSSSLKKKLNKKIPLAVIARDSAKPVLDQAKARYAKAKEEVNVLKSLLVCKELDLEKKKELQKDTPHISFEDMKKQMEELRVEWHNASKECEKASTQFKEEISQFLETYFPNELRKFHPKLRHMLHQMATSWKDLSPIQISRNVSIVTDRGD